MSVPLAALHRISGGAPIEMPSVGTLPRVPPPPSVITPAPVPRPTAINIVVIIRVNSPGNDGPIVQVDARRLTGRARALTGLLRAIGRADCATAAPDAPAALRRCTAALVAAARGGAVSGDRLPRAARDRAFQRPLAQRRQPWHTLVTWTPARAAAVTRAAPPADPPRRAALHRRVAAAPAAVPAPAPIPLIDLLPSSPGHSTVATPGTSGPGGVAIGLVTLLSLSVLRQPLGRRRRIGRPLRDALLGTRLEHPG